MRLFAFVYLISYRPVVYNVDGMACFVFVPQTQSDIFAVHSVRLQTDILCTYTTMQFA